MWHVLLTTILYSTVCIICVMILLIIYYNYSLKHWEKLGVPHPKPSFPFGNVTDFTQLGQTIARIYFDMKTQGHAYCGYYIFAMPVFMPIDPIMNKHLLTIHYNSFGDRGLYSDEVNDPMGSSLMTWSGDKWKKMRAKLAPSFSPAKAKMMFPIIQKCCVNLENLFQEYAMKQEPIDILDVMKRYTVDVICSCAFGVEGGCIYNPNSEFIKHANIIFSTKITNTMRLVIGQSASSISKFFKIQLFDPIATHFFRKVVYDTVAYREKHNIERQDILNLLIRLKNNKSIQDGEEVSDKMTTEGTITLDEIASQLFLFFLGGFETSATTLHFMLYELAKNEGIQCKAREEIIKCVKKNGDVLDYEAIKDMRYLSNVLHETLRKYPAIHMLHRMCTEDFTIPGTNITIKKGTRAVLSTLGIHWDPEYYPNPEVFDPNRFTDEAKANRPPFTYLSFGEGPRICPGYRFGIVQINLCVASLLLKYKFSVHPSCSDIVLHSIGSILGTEKPILLYADKL